MKDKTQDFISDISKEIHIGYIEAKYFGGMDIDWNPLDCNSLE